MLNNNNSHTQGQADARDCRQLNDRIKSVCEMEVNPLFPDDRRSSQVACEYAVTLYNCNAAYQCSYCGAAIAAEMTEKMRQETKASLSKGNCPNY